ncbi:hypothetical protein SAMN02799622_04590 [Methylobacterium sp. UNC378MF]|uniref:hypothetical protein n=1 Tax=Methylobacterium sp. UNC378MF TaxID=1502748 RepID=UPI00088B287A|nr:hypothetical protein [Methylobacterium sp. UNC378MF]SDA29926.1 hypothetical protein SAMN02799622_04590 [Methylobacterium sp. UNC378MF]
MWRPVSLAVSLLGLAATRVHAQAINPTPGTEPAQSNGLLGMPSLLLVGVIIAFAVLYALRARRR